MTVCVRRGEVETLIPLRKSCTQTPPAKATVNTSVDKTIAKFRNIRFKKATSLSNSSIYALFRHMQPHKL